MVNFKLNVVKLNVKKTSKLHASKASYLSKNYLFMFFFVFLFCFRSLGWFSIPSRFKISCYCALANTKFFPLHTLLTSPSFFCTHASRHEKCVQCLSWIIYFIFCCFFSIVCNKIDGRVSLSTPSSIPFFSPPPNFLCFCLFSSLGLEDEKALA